MKNHVYREIIGGKPRQQWPKWPQISNAGETPIALERSVLQPGETVWTCRWDGTENGIGQGACETCGMVRA